MSIQANVVMIGVSDVSRSKEFYGEGLGAELAQDHANFVSFDLGDGSAKLAIYQWDAVAGDAGVPSEGSGFRGVSFHFLVSSADAVDETIARAVAAGGSPVKAAAAQPWGGYSGYFADPDGYLWKVASS